MAGINGEIKSTPQIYKDKYVSDGFADSITRKYNELSEKYDIDEVENIIILSNSDADKIKEFSGIDITDKNLLTDYVSGEAKDSFGFYSKKAKTFVFMERNHETKDKKLEGSLEEQAADTLSHEFGHLFGNENSKSDEFRSAYMSDLEAIYEQLILNPDEKVGESDMTYKEAVEYFAHYMEGVDFSDGIDEKDITDKGAKENYAEAFSIINDTEYNASNHIFETLFEHSIKQVAVDCYQ